MNKLKQCINDSIIYEAIFQASAMSDTCTRRVADKVSWAFDSVGQQITYELNDMLLNKVTSFVQKLR